MTGERKVNVTKGKQGFQETEKAEPRPASLGDVADSVVDPKRIIFVALPKGIRSHAIKGDAAQTLCGRDTSDHRVLEDQGFGASCRQCQDRLPRQR